MLRRWEIILILIGLPLSIAAGAVAVDHHVTPKTAPHGFSAVRETPSTTDTVPEPTTTSTTTDPAAVRQAYITAYWWRMHGCEQPLGEWDASNSWLGGGIGISYAAWREWGGLQFADLPQHATPEQQIVIAQRGYERVVTDYRSAVNAWGCVATVGMEVP